jgi:hypothetical protein
VSPASLARGAACPAVELMRRGERLAGRLLRAREPFEERITGVLSSLRERGFSCCPQMGRELGRRRDRCSRPPATVITAGPFLAALTAAPGWRCWVVRWVASSRGIGSAIASSRGIGPGVAMTLSLRAEILGPRRRPRLGRTSPKVSSMPRVLLPPSNVKTQACRIRSSCSVCLLRPPRPEHTPSLRCKAASLFLLF